MDRSSFNLRTGASPARRDTTAIPVERTLTTRPVRRTFSSYDAADPRADQAALAETVERIDDPPDYLDEHSRMHHPNSVPGFGPLHLKSTEGLGIEIDNARSEDPEISTAREAEESETDDSNTEGSQVHKDRTGQGEDPRQILDPSFSHIEDLIDGLYELQRLPEDLQEGFEGMREQIKEQTTALSKEKERSAALIRDLAEARQNVDCLKDGEKEWKILLLDMENQIKSSETICDNLRHELGKMNDSLASERAQHGKVSVERERELRAKSEQLKVAEENLQKAKEESDRGAQELTLLRRRIQDEISLRENAASELHVVKGQLSNLEELSRKQKQRWEHSDTENKQIVTQLQSANARWAETVKALEVTARNQGEANKVLAEEIEQVEGFVSNICFMYKRFSEAQAAHVGGCEFHGKLRILQDLSVKSKNTYEDTIAWFSQVCAALQRSPANAKASKVMGNLDSFFREFLLQAFTQEMAHRGFIEGLDVSFAELREARMGMALLLDMLSSLVPKVSNELGTVREKANAAKTMVLKTMASCEQAEKLFSKREAVLRTENDALTKDLDASRKALSAVEKDLKDGREQLTKDMGRLKKLVAEEMASKDALEKRLKQTERRKDDVQRKADVSIKEAQELQRLLGCLDEEQAMHEQRKKSAVEELRKCQTTLCDSKQQIARLVYVTGEARATSEEETAKLVHENDVLRKDRDMKANALADALGAVREMSVKVKVALAEKATALMALVKERKKKIPKENCSNPACASKAREEATKGKRYRDTHGSQGSVGNGRKSQPLTIENPSPRKRKETRPGETKELSKSDSGPLETRHHFPQGAATRERSAETTEVKVTPKRGKKRPPVRSPNKSPTSKRLRARTLGIATPTDKDLAWTGMRSPIASRDKIGPLSTPECGKDDDWYVDAEIGILEG